MFRSDTDTEVIPKLCNYVYNNTPEHLPFNEVRSCLPPCNLNSISSALSGHNIHSTSCLPSLAQLERAEGTPA